MIFVSPDIASALRHWELGEYVSEGFVILGCAGELVADLATCIPRRKRRRIERWSTILLVLALTVGLKCLVRTNELSGSVIGSLGDEAEEADNKAKTAITDSSTALSQAKDAMKKAVVAQGSLGRAEDEANHAQSVSSNAFRLASGARKEADSFEQDIVSAKNQAAQAESHLAGALKETANAERELAEYKAQNAPRRLTPEQQRSIATKLASFPGERGDIVWNPGSFETAQFASDIRDAFIRAGWKSNIAGESPGFNNLPAVSGVFIFTMPTDRSEAVGRTLFKALQHEGVGVFLKPMASIEPSITMVIRDRKSLAEEETRLFLMVGTHP